MKFHEIPNPVRPQMKKFIPRFKLDARWVSGGSKYPDWPELIMFTAWLMGNFNSFPD